jgi:VIT1/CCC1 family predicted Fe2+/Mn2+ transporter
MGEDKKNRGFMDMIKDGLDYIIQRTLANMSLPITEGVEKAMQNLEDSIIRIEERVLRKIFSFLLIGFGAIFLVFALFFFLREFLGWSNSAAFFSIGVLMIVIGLLLKTGNRKGGKNEHSCT